jgi:hypothetical protein
MLPMDDEKLRIYIDQPVEHPAFSWRQFVLEQAKSLIQGQD